MFIEEIRCVKEFTRYLFRKCNLCKYILKSGFLMNIAQTKQSGRCAFENRSPLMFKKSQIIIIYYFIYTSLKTFFFLLKKSSFHSTGNFIINRTKQNPKKKNQLGKRLAFRYFWIKHLNNNRKKKKC